MEPQSRPTRARGLKQPDERPAEPDPWVAPHTGAWIETTERRRRSGRWPVAPHTGAWIETSAISTAAACTLRSRPTRARGLKLLLVLPLVTAVRSRPTRARGLKRALPNYRSKLA